MNIKDTINKILLQTNLFFTKVFDKTFKAIKANSQTAVKVTQIIRDAVESPIANFVVSLTPTNVDNEILAKLQLVMPQVLNYVAIVQGIYTEAKTNNEAIAAIVEHLKGISSDKRIDFWVRFSAELNNALSDGKLSFAEALALTQTAFIELYGTIKQAA